MGKAFKCFCGEVVVEVRGPPDVCSFCHCSICRRTTGAPFSANALFKKANTDVDGETTGFFTSKHVSRFRCRKCACPVYATIGKKTIVVPLAAFEWGEEGSQIEDPAWKPQHHLHYGMRIFDVADDLPKYVGGHQGPRFEYAASPADR